MFVFAATGGAVPARDGGAAVVLLGRGDPAGPRHAPRSARRPPRETQGRLGQLATLHRHMRPDRIFARNFLTIFKSLIINK